MMKLLEGKRRGTFFKEGGNAGKRSGWFSDDDDEIVDVVGAGWWVVTHASKSPGAA